MKDETRVFVKVPTDLGYLPVVGWIVESALPDNVLLLVDKDSPLTCSTILRIMGNNIYYPIQQEWIDSDVHNF